MWVKALPFLGPPDFLGHLHVSTCTKLLEVYIFPPETNGWKLENLRRRFSFHLPCDFFWGDFSASFSNQPTPEILVFVRWLGFLPTVEVAAPKITTLYRRFWCFVPPSSRKNPRKTVGKGGNKALVLGWIHHSFRRGFVFLQEKSIEDWLSNLVQCCPKVWSGTSSKFTMEPKNYGIQQESPFPWDD